MTDYNTREIDEKLMIREQFISLLETLNVPDQEIAAQTRAKWDSLREPAASFGQLELIHQRMAAIQGMTDPASKPRTLFIFGADNGIVAEGISLCGKQVTAQVMRDIAAEKSVTNTLGHLSETTVIPVNLGVRDLNDEEGIIHVAVKADGTESFARTEAMSEIEMMLAIQLGYEMAIGAVNNGYRILMAGQAGSGNTSTSTALLAALEETNAASICGRLPGISDQQSLREQEIISAALSKHNLSADDPLTAVRTVGGFDIAAMVGFYAAAALNNIPVILDDLVSQVAAVVLRKLQPNISHYLFAAHQTTGPGCELALRSLGLTSFLDLDLYHGAGVGALLALPLFDSAVSIYRRVCQKCISG